MSKKIIQTLILLALLVGFPLVSWIYLSDGLDFRLDALAALEPKAELPPLTDTLHRPGQIMVLFDFDHPGAHKMDQVRSHFEDRVDVVFLDFPKPAIPELEASLRSALTISEDEAALAEMVFLVGQKGQIRRNYLITDDDQLGDLTEHIAFLVPPDPKRDFEFRREAEK